MKVDTPREVRKAELERGGALKVAKKRALVVDDEPGVSALIQEVLGSVDIEAVALEEREQIGRRIKEEKFDVALIGLCGPGWKGVETARMIRESGLNRMTPIIMISGDQSPSALSRGFESGATFFAYKPLDRAHLLGLIRVSQGAIEHEKRRFRRVPLQAKVRIKSSHAEVLGETVDISLNGAMVKVPQTVPVGSMVEVSLYLLAGAQPIVGLGTIVRIMDGEHMGILIDRLSPMEVGRLQDFLLPRIDDPNPGKRYRDSPAPKT
jgi:DNA-binding response OmpR family regulator